MRVNKNLVCGTAGATLIGLIGLSAPLMYNASAAPSMVSATSVHLKTGPTGNKVEMVDPAHSTYIPNITGASDGSRAKAQRLFDGVNRFCSTHTASGLKGRWRAGMNLARPTHYFNPKPNSMGLHPANPRAALVYDGKIGGVMFTGRPLPYLGTIPRAHRHSKSMPSMSMHHMSGPVEMIHVYCSNSLKEAFTPNRMLGVRGDVQKLRLRIRPAIMDLNKAHLHAVVLKVRGYTGNKQQPVSSANTSVNKSGPDPVLQKMRTEIRRSLMVLREGQLRSLWSLMQSY